MQTAEIKLPSIEMIQQFVKAVNGLEADVDLGSGATIIDAKSILGVMTLVSESTRKFKLTVYSEDKTVLDNLQPFLAY